jgi:hypothetical protein
MIELHVLEPLGNLFEELRLLLLDPVNYILLITYPTHKYVTIRNFNPRSKKIGIKILNLLKVNFPRFNIFLTGSSALEIPGRGDIDLIAGCPKKYFRNYVPELIKMFGKPHKKARNIIEWAFKYEDCDVELCLVDPNYKLYKRYAKSLEILSRKENREKYLALKLESDGLSERAYERKRLKLFVNLGIRG